MTRQQLSKKWEGGSWDLFRAKLGAFPTSSFLLLTFPTHQKLTQKLSRYLILFFSAKFPKGWELGVTGTYPLSCLLACLVRWIFHLPIINLHPDSTTTRTFLFFGANKVWWNTENPKAFSHSQVFNFYLRIVTNRLYIMMILVVIILVFQRKRSSSTFLHGSFFYMHPSLWLVYTFAKMIKKGRNLLKQYDISFKFSILFSSQRGLVKLLSA